MVQPVILSGGSGTRLWPLSRELYPKQLLPLTGDQSLLQQTVARLEGIDSAPADSSAKEPIIICNDQHRFLVAEQLRQINVRAKKIILEPIGRNTAPALTLAALQCLNDKNDDILLVMPADHVIADNAAFHAAIDTGVELAKQSALVTFGIVPTQAETGYGYIKQGEMLKSVKKSRGTAKAFTLAAFVEKPDIETAKQYLQSGDYLWNSGMFMMLPSLWLQQVEIHQPAILKACRLAFDNGVEDLDFFRVEESAFEQCPKDSIDYAVMEHTATNSVSDIRTGQVFGAVVPLDAGWSDVGVWSSLWEVVPQDKSGNVVRGDVITHDTKDSFIHAEDRLVACVGIDNMVIVETSDAVLVMPKNRAQDVKSIVETLAEQKRDERVVHRQVYRPWGSYEGVVSGERFQVKRIKVNPGASLSLQMHHHRAEHWIVVKGTAKVTRGEEEFLLSENESTYIPLGTVHRLENPGSLPLEIIEVQSGSYLGEDDIVRLEDNYGRNNE
jgi:mannose-1-phosphate guanylyltransferase/mannose-6-phosphate isomerase